jgi:hypothetical protein
VRFWPVLIIAACSKGESPRKLDPDLVKVSSDARMRTDIVGDGEFTDTATFVLVDAENTSGDGAYVTLGGELADAGGQVVGHLNPVSLWIPAHESRTYALVDSERKPRPTAAGAKILMKGAQVPTSPPTMHVEDVHQFDDHGRIVVNGTLVNDADREGTVMVVASFHDATNRPMKRPYQMLNVAARHATTVQFIGPPSSTTGTIFVGDMAY